MVFNKSKITLENLFLLSILLEPLLFFLLAGRNSFGFNINISRIIQVVVLLGLVFKFLVFKSRVLISNHTLKISLGYFIFSGYMIFLTFIGIFIGVYGESAYDLLPIRTVLEIVISIYYFIYFAILPTYFFRTVQSKIKVLNILNTAFKVFLFLGFLDLIFLSLGLPSIPRHIGDVEVGFRFHSIAGEPRDAAVFIVFGLATLFLNKIYDPFFKISKSILLFSALAFILTVSVSAILALIFISSLFIAYFLRLNLLSFPLRRYVQFFFLISIFLYISFEIIFSFNRMELYLKAFEQLYFYLQQGLVPQFLGGQMVNIYPIWQRFVELLDYNFYGIIFGSGIGTSSIINNIFYDLSDLSLGEVLNPHANIIRLFYEGGIIGSSLLLFGLLSSFKHLTKDRSQIIGINYLFLAVFGAFMAHRSLVFFIFLGLIYMLFSNQQPHRKKLVK